MRFATVAALCSCACLFAESPTAVFDKAPPETDKALRARVAGFFDAHVSGKFRLAEPYVHDDSKDIFYDSSKSKLLGYEIVRINYSDNFTKAVVITNTEMEWATARLGKIRVKPPMKTMWKLDAGQWWWYAVPQTNWETPFGVMNPGSDPSKQTRPRWTITDAGELRDQVKLSKNDIRLSGFQKSEDRAEITNGMPAEVTLTVDASNAPPGLTVKLSSDKLASGEKADITFTYDPPDKSPKAPTVISVRVAETGIVYGFTINYALQPELEKMIPKGINR